MKQKLFSKDFTLVVIGQIISLFGNATIRFALPLYLLNLTGSFWNRYGVCFSACRSAVACGRHCCGQGE